MFSSINLQDESRVESISRFWLQPSNVSLLRDLSTKHSLVCPKCKDSVIYKNGLEKSAHFAHRATKGHRHCTLEKERRSGTESRMLSQIFEELEKHPQYDAQVDVLLEGTDQTIDLLISKDGKILCAYWILDRGRREDTLARLTAPLKTKGIPYQFIFTGDSISESSKRHISMSSSVEREARYTAKYDLEEVDVESGEEYGHLNYYDEKTSDLKVYRGIYNGTFGMLRTIAVSQLIVDEKGNLLCIEDLEHAENALKWIDEQERATRRRVRFAQVKRMNKGTWGSY